MLTLEEQEGRVLPATLSFPAVQRDLAFKIKPTPAR